MKDFSNYKFRASGLGNIMTSLALLTPKQKETLAGLQAKEKLTEKQQILLGDLLKKKNQPPKLSKGAEGYCLSIHQDLIFDRSEQTISKYLSKGTQAEDISINLYSELTETFVVKNENRFENDYVGGTPDAIVDGMVIDFKTSWNFKTFPLHETEVQKMYYWQLMTYMWLTGMKRSEIVYCLVSTPINLIQDEMRRMDWKFGITDNDGNIRKEREELILELIINHCYTIKDLQLTCAELGVDLNLFDGRFKEIAPEHRMKIFNVSYNEEDIELIKRQVGLGREYLNNLLLNL